MDRASDWICETCLTADKCAQSGKFRHSCDSWTAILDADFIGAHHEDE